MKIAVPSSDDSGLDSTVFLHFGRCPFYTLVDTESGDVEILRNDSTHFGGSKSPPGLLIDNGVSVLVCGDLGRKAIALFEDAGIDICIGAKGTVREAVEAWKKGELKGPSEGYTCK